MQKKRGGDSGKPPPKLFKSCAPQRVSVFEPTAFRLMTGIFPRKQRPCHINLKLRGFHQGQGAMPAERQEEGTRDLERGTTEDGRLAGDREWRQEGW